MGVAEVLLIIGCAALVIGVIAASIVRKAKGKTSCDCGGNCAHCAGCCHVKK